MNIEAQTGATRKSDTTDIVSDSAEFPRSRPSTDALYDAMTKARRASVIAWNRWLAHAQPSPSDAADEADGTSSQLRQMAEMLLPKEAVDGR